MRLIFASTALALAIACTATADQVTLDDGSKLVGTIVRIADGKVTLQTAFAGELSIDQARVTGLSTDEKRAVTLASGDRVVGTLALTDGGQKLRSDVFGEADIDVAKVAGVWPVGENGQPVAPETQAVEQIRQEHQQEVAALKEEHAAQMKALEEELDKHRKVWTARLELGVTGKTGNTESLSMVGRAEARRTTDFDRLLLYMQGHYAKQDGERSANEFLGGANLEVDITHRLFAFGKLELETDEFEDLDLRARVTGGLGYFLIREENHELKVRGGLGYQHETFDDGSSEGEAVAEAGFDYKKQLNSWLLFTHSTTWYPALSDPSDFRLVSETAGEMPLGDGKDWKLRIGMRNEYDSEPQPGVDELDTLYFLNFVYDVD